MQASYEWLHNATRMEESAGRSIRLIRSDRTEMQRKPNWKERYIPMKGIDKAVEVSAETMRIVLKGDSMSFAALLRVALASFVAAPKPALAAEPQHHEQGPAVYRLKVGELE